MTRARLVNHRISEQPAEYLDVHTYASAHKMVKTRGGYKVMLEVFVEDGEARELHELLHAHPFFIEVGPVQEETPKLAKAPEQVVAPVPIGTLHDAVGSW